MHVFALAFLVASCGQTNRAGSGIPERVTVIKVINTYGDYKEKDYGRIKKLCLTEREGSISEETFQNEYKDRRAYLVSGPAIKFSVSTQIDERKNRIEEYHVKIPVLTFVNGIAMNDGEYRLEKRTRKVSTGRIRRVYGECTAFEYHF